MAGNWHPTTPCWDPLDPDQETERCRATKARARKLCDPIGRQSTWRAASIRCALCGVCGVLDTSMIQMGYLDATITSQACYRRHQTVPLHPGSLAPVKLILPSGAAIVEESRCPVGVDSFRSPTTNSPSRRRWHTCFRASIRTPLLHGQAPLLKKFVMLRPCWTTFNPGASSSLCPLVQPQTPSRAAGSFTGPEPAFIQAKSMSARSEVATQQGRWFGSLLGDCDPACAPVPDNSVMSIGYCKLMILAAENDWTFFTPVTRPALNLGAPTVPFSQHSFFRLI